MNGVNRQSLGSQGPFVGPPSAVLGPGAPVEIKSRNRHGFLKNEDFIPSRFSQGPDKFCPDNVLSTLISGHKRRYILSNFCS